MAHIKGQIHQKQGELSHSLIPIGLREASFDSPTFRATAVHFSDQVAIIEKWLSAYIKSICKLIYDVTTIEESFYSVISRSEPPLTLSEAVIDHDYTLLAIKRLGDSSRDWWSQVISSTKKMENNIVEPVRLFLLGEFVTFKDARKNLEQTQKIYDQILARYVGQSKTRAPSALREDAFQVYEARKTYLKASLDFCILAPQFRFAIDKLLIQVSCDQWREMKRSCENSMSNFTKLSSQMDRIRGWNKELEASEAVLRRELHFAKQEIAELNFEISKPSREIDDYNISTVAFLGSKNPLVHDLKDICKDNQGSEKQGWLFLRTTTGKPVRTSWVRRWFYVKAGLFGWLTQGINSGAVEESGRIGVLLCNIKPAVQEDRRFCFEIKTKVYTLLVQAETQNQLMEWLEVLEQAKKTTLLANAHTPTIFDSIDFGLPASIYSDSRIKSVDSTSARINSEINSLISSRVNPLSILGTDTTFSSLGTTAEVNSYRQYFFPRDEGEIAKDHTTRIIQRLDPTRKPVVSSSENPSSNSQKTSSIASKILASHDSFPLAVNQAAPNILSRSIFPSETKKSTLAPTTLAIAPTPTSLSKKAIFMNGDRYAKVNILNGGIPSVIVANFWGSSTWEYIGRPGKGETDSVNKLNNNSPFSYPKINITAYDSRSDENYKPRGRIEESYGVPMDSSIAIEIAPQVSRQGSFMSGDRGATKSQNYMTPDLFPTSYPLELRAQDAQFRILFPGVPRTDKVLLVFRAIWNSNEQQEFPGRVYVTQHDLYFYSHHLGLVLIAGVSMKSISEVTAAPGKDCDFIFLHIRENSFRITLKTFLEPLRLLQARLSFLIDKSENENSAGFEDTLTTLIMMENEESIIRRLSWESLEDVSLNIPADVRTENDHKNPYFRNFSCGERRFPTGKAKKEMIKFRLPSQPVTYEPTAMQQKVIERQFNVSSKALFHAIFGDNSYIFQNFYYRRGAENISQGPWLSLDEIRKSRELKFLITKSNPIQLQKKSMADHQLIDIKDDHLCYVVSYTSIFWHLPYHSDFRLLFKIAITYVTKSKSKLSIYAKVDWSRKPLVFRRLIEDQALRDSVYFSEKLTEEITDQIGKLGSNSRTKKSLQLFGLIGQQKSSSEFSSRNSGPIKFYEVKQRTIIFMLLKSLITNIEIILTSGIIYVLSTIKLIRNIAFTHRHLLFVLFLSLLINVLFTFRETSSWWSERKAVKFMNKVGIGPNQITSRAIYLKDLDEALKFKPVENLGFTDGKCFKHFKWIVNVTDLDLPHHLAGKVLLDTATQSTAKRLRKIRQNLGSYRHSILIASRLVNKVEREIFRAEWENWLLDENIKCKQISFLLNKKIMNISQLTRNESIANTSRDSKIEKWLKSRKLEALRKWKEAYCGSCKVEQDLMIKEKNNLEYD